MTRLAGLVLAAVGGYLVARHRDDLRAAVVELRKRQAAQERASRSWEDETEFTHEYEREAARRHELADEIRRHPLRERPVDDAERIASQPIRRERDDHPYPTSY